jgi:RimJ/RimL family protein N-acetyltransferase
MLRDYPKEVVLKGGEKVTLRPMVKEDGPKLLEFFSRLSEEDRLFLRDDVANPKVIELWVRNLNYEHIIPILAEKDERIIGDATLHLKKTDQPSSMGEIRIVTDGNFRRRGLGTLLAKELYFLALSLNLDRLVAEVVEDQHTVIKTFESLGFRRETVLKNKAIDLRGKKHNLVIMRENVRALWKKMEDLIERDIAHYSRE